jgi:hypothetical protein
MSSGVPETQPPPWNRTTVGPVDPYTSRLRIEVNATCRAAAIVVVVGGAVVVVVGGTVVVVVVVGTVVVVEAVVVVVVVETAGSDAVVHAASVKAARSASRFTGSGES